MGPGNYCITSLSKLVFEGLDEYKEFYLENSKIEFKGNSDSINTSIITGSKSEDERVLYYETDSNGKYVYRQFLWWLQG